MNQEESEHNEIDGMKGADSKSGWRFVMTKIRMVELGRQGAGSTRRLNRDEIV